MDTEVRRVIEHLDKKIFTGPETWFSTNNPDFRPYRDGRDSTCLFLGLVKGLHTLGIVQQDHMRQLVIDALGFPSLLMMVQWNDHPSRTFEDVKRLLGTTLAEP